MMTLLLYIHVLVCGFICDTIALDILYDSNNYDGCLMLSRKKGLSMHKLCATFSTRKHYIIDGVPRTQTWRGA